MGGARQSAVECPFAMELRNVDREFVISREPLGSKQKINALSRVSLKLRSGEFVFLTGPSGAGKTTLLRLVLGLDNPSVGEVFTLGQNLSALGESKRRALRRQIGVIFQDHRLLHSLNVWDNVELPLHFINLSPRDRRHRVEEILETVQMLDHAHESVISLSAGEKQRVGIARALVHCPSLIIADEPTGNLDPVAARSLIRMLRELKGHGSTVFIATHDMSLVRDFGGRVLELVGGSLPSRDSAQSQKAYRVPDFWRPGNISV